jgi:hypothetical protein
MPKEHSAIDLLKCTLAPTEYTTLPPSTYTQPTFAKRIDLFGSFTIGGLGTPLALAENIPQTTGAIVWLPGRGVASMYRFAIVPMGTTSTGYAQSVIAAGGGNNGTNQIQLASVLQYFAGGTPSTPGPAPYTSYNKVSLRFGSNVPVPYWTTGDTITSSPPPNDATLSKTRIFAGSMRVVSDTVGIGATTLSGYLTAVAVSNIQDVFGGGTYQAQGSYPSFFPGGFPSGQAYGLEVGTLVQQAVLPKDVIKEVSVTRGVVTLVGPDIAPTMSPPDPESLFRQNGTMFKTIAMTGMTTSANLVPLLQGHGPELLYLAWVSPWDVQDTTAYTVVSPGPVPNGGVPNVQNIFAGPINAIGGALEITVNFNIIPSTGTMPAGYFEQTIVGFWHVFVSTSSGGALYYDQATEMHTVSSTIEDQSYVYQFSATGNAKKFMTGGFANWNAVVPVVPQYSAGTPTAAFASQTTPPNCGGMYLGTWIIVLSQNVGNNTTAATVAPSYIPAGNIMTRAVDDYCEGELGPCRVVRYDQLQAATATVPGMVLRVDAVAYAECIPGAITAPYVQSAGNMNRSCCNFNALSFLSFCYNQDDTPFRRCWDSYEWRDMVKGLLPQLSPEFIRSFGSDRLISAAKAAGVPMEESESKRARKDSRAVSVYPSSLAPQEFGPPLMDTASRLKNLDDIMSKVQHETERTTVYKPPPNY